MAERDHTDGTKTQLQQQTSLNMIIYVTADLTISVVKGENAQHGA